LNIKVENSRILLEFPLTQAKRSWKIRKAREYERPKTLKLKYVIEEGDAFEWMITNEEVRDILSVLRCVSNAHYKIIRKQVEHISEFVDELREEINDGISLEARLRPKQKKAKELTPYLFVLLRLDSTTDTHYLVNKRGKRINRPLGYALKAGDKLNWLIKPNQIEVIVTKLASLDRSHLEKVKQEIFRVLEDDQTLARK
jgi:gas vesicle protein